MGPIGTIGSLVAVRFDLLTPGIEVGLVTTNLDAMVAFYTAPRTLADVVDHVVGKVLDVLRIEHDLAPRWGGAAADQDGPD